MARLYFNIWPFTSTKICPMAYKISQRRSKILSNTKWTLKNCPRLWRYCQSGEISPNLVTLSKLVSHWGKPESDVTQRQVRRLLAEGRITSYDKGELVVKLQDMDFGEEEALLAAENCEDVYSATKFLRQECELCANTMNVTEVRWQNIFKIKTFLKPHSHGFYWGHQC